MPNVTLKDQITSAVARIAPLRTGLVVDDSIAAVRLILRVCELRGVLCRHVTTVDEALQLLRNDRPGFMILDYHLGNGVVGPDVLACCVREGITIPPTVLCTSDCTSPEVIEAMNRFNLPLAPKPVDIVSLLGLVALQAGLP